MAIDIELIKRLVELLEGSQLGELEVETKNLRVRLAKPKPEAPNPIMAPVVPQAAPAPAPTQGAAGAPEAQAPEEPEEGLHPIKSPIVGTFYRAPAPGAPPFVEVGDHVSPGQTLCIVEAMKVMNEIESDVSGTVVKILVENGEPVEHGQTLFLIKPD